MEYRIIAQLNVSIVMCTITHKNAFTCMHLLPMLNDQMIKENNDKLLIFLLFQLESFYNFPSHF